MKAKILLYAAVIFQVIILAVAQQVYAGEAVMTYYDSTDPTVPKYRVWDGTSWSAESSALSVGTGANIQWMVIKASPVRDEYILGTLDDDGHVNVQFYREDGWGDLIELTDRIGTVNDAYRGFDISYERTTGRAVVVYSDGTALPKYRIWDNGNWSMPGNVSAVGTGTVYWIRLEASPQSDEIVLVTQDSNADIYAQVWDGTGWGNVQVLETTAENPAYQDLDVAYEYTSGNAMVVWADTNQNTPRYRIWDGSSWSSEAGANNVGSTAIRWIKLAAEPGSDRILMGTLDGGSDVNVQVWTGSAWGTNFQPDPNVESNTKRNFDVAWENSSGVGMVVYGEGGASDAPRYRTCSGAGCQAGTWSSETFAIDTNPGNGDPEWLRLAPDPYSNDIMLMHVDDQNDIGIQRWSSSAWGDGSSVETSSANDYERFSIAYRIFNLPEVQVNVSTDKNAYDLGEIVQLTVNTTNSSGAPLQASQYLDIILGNTTIPWWNTSWSYRIPINVTEQTGGFLTDFQVNFSIDTQTLIADGKMQSSCQDMRFSWFDWSAKENVEIPYWIKSGCNTTATQVFVKIPFIPAGSNATIFMYYNNSQASSKSSISKVMDAEIGSTAVGDAFTTVNLQGTYKNPVVVTFHRESANTLPVSVMVRNVTSSSFEVALKNPSGSAVSSETVYYLVIEEGLSRFIDGTTIEAHTLVETHTIGRNSGDNTWGIITFGHSFSISPVVLAQVMTDWDPRWVTDHVSALTATDGDIAMEVGEAFYNHGDEIMGWVAIARGVTGTVNGVRYETGASGDVVQGHDNGCYSTSFTQSFTSSPLVLGDLSKRDGSDGGWLVMCSLSSTAYGAHVDEDQISDSERSHTTEDSGFLAVGGAGTLAVQKYASALPAYTLLPEQQWVARNSSPTSSNGILVWNWSSVGSSIGNYSAVSRASSTGYLNSTSYTNFVLNPNSPPNVTVIYPPDSSVISGTITVNASAQDTTGVGSIFAVFTGPGTGRQYNMTLYQGGIYDGNWSNSSIDTTLFMDGVWNITANASDSVGVYNDTVFVTVTIDNYIPSISFASPTPSNASVIDTAYVYVNVTLDEEGDTVYLEWTNSTGSYNLTMNKAGAAVFWYNVTLTGDYAGGYSYRVYANDTNNNWNVSEMRAVTVRGRLVTESNYSMAPASVTAAVYNVTMMNMTLNATGEAINITGITVTKTGNYANSYVNVSLYWDVDQDTPPNPGNSSIDADDVLLAGPATFQSSGTYTFSLSPAFQINTTATRTIVIYYDIFPLA